jgi:predicted nuclease with TOPRIM domain
MDGVNMAGIQALEKRTSEMKNEFDSKINNLIADNNALAAENKKLKDELAEFKKDIAQIKSFKAELEEQTRLAKSQNQNERIALVNNKTN